MQLWFKAKWQSIIELSGAAYGLFTEFRHTAGGGQDSAGLYLFIGKTGGGPWCSRYLWYWRTPYMCHAFYISFCGAAAKHRHERRSGRCDHGHRTSHLRRRYNFLQNTAEVSLDEGFTRLRGQKHLPSPHLHTLLCSWSCLMWVLRWDGCLEAGTASSSASLDVLPD